MADIEDIERRLHEGFNWLKWAEDRVHHALAVGKFVCLRAHNGKYVQANLNEDGALQAAAGEPQTWERFRVLDMGDGKVALRACNGKYVQVDPRNDKLRADAMEPLPQCVFYLSGSTGNTVALKAANDRWLGTDLNSPVAPLTAWQTEIKEWERFSLRVVDHDELLERLDALDRKLDALICLSPAGAKSSAGMECRRGNDPLSDIALCIVVGVGDGPSAFDQPIADHLLAEVGRLHPMVPAKILTDGEWFDKFQGKKDNPAIAVGGPQANRLSGFICQKGNRGCLDGNQSLHVDYLKSGRNPMVALWGDSAAETRASVEAYVAAEKEGIIEFLAQCGWD